MTTSHITSRSETSWIDMNCFRSWIAEMATIEERSFSFERAEVDRAHPLGPVLVPAVVDARDEVLVSRQDHDDKQRAGEREVDESEHAEDHL